MDAPPRLAWEVFVGMDGDMYGRNTMTQVSTPEVYFDYYGPDQTADHDEVTDEEFTKDIN